MPPRDQSAYLKLKIQGSDCSMDVRRVEVEDNDRLIDKVTISLDDTRRSYTDFVQRDNTVWVEMGWATEYAVLFEGVVTEVVADARRDGVRRVTVKALDPSSKLHREPKTRDLPEGTLKNVITGLISAAGIPIGQVDPSPDPNLTGAQRVRQQNETDWEVIQRLALRYSARAFVEYQGDAAKFFFVPESRLLQGDKMGDLTYCRGYRQLMEFRVERVGSGATPPRTASTVNPETGDVVTTTAGQPTPPETPPTPDPDQLATLNRIDPRLGARYSAAATTAAGVTPATPAAPQQVAGQPSDPTIPTDVGRRDPTRILGLLGRGVAIGTVKLRAKGKVGINGISVWAEGDWYVRRVNHIFTRATVDRRERTSYETRFVATR